LGWQVIGSSVRGAAHERAALPNQDALAWTCLEAGGPALAVAVADGHGSAKSFRSEVGARLAVEAALESLRELAELPAETPHSARKRLTAEALPRALVKRWREAVDADLLARPFAAEELAGLAAAQGEAACEAVASSPRLAYGATVVALLASEASVLYLQLGDGDVLAVASDGGVTRPLAGDARLFANETTSLCGEEAWSDARTTYETLAGAPPALILLTTDGYPTSFQSDEDFLRVGPDLLDLLRREGPAAVGADLPHWLAAASQEGSGDDVSVAIVYRSDAAAAR
jgi:serine/threonine protein phosphatase PrpC